jgi:hypothetical protein
MRPKRSAELIGGNLYWIVGHRLVAGQEIVAIEDRDDGRIDIVCKAELRRITPRYCKAHQGWRYLSGEYAPDGKCDESELGLLPPQLYGRLAALALV